MRRERRFYGTEFKQNAVDLLLSSEKSTKQIADDLGIDYYNLHRWKLEFMQEQPDKNQRKSETPEEKIRRLEQEVKNQNKQIANLREERDILKKAMGIVSKR